MNRQAWVSPDGRVREFGAALIRLDAFNKHYETHSESLMRMIGEDKDSGMPWKGTWIRLGANPETLMIDPTPFTFTGGNAEIIERVSAIEKNLESILEWANWPPRIVVDLPFGLVETSSAELMEEGIRKVIFRNTPVAGLYTGRRPEKSQWIHQYRRLK